MKTQAAIKNQIKSVIEEITLGQTLASGINDKALLLGDLGLDSLDYASTFLELERWLDIKVKEEGVRWENLRTVEDLSEFLFEQQKQQ